MNKNIIATLREKKKSAIIKKSKELVNKFIKSATLNGQIYFDVIKNDNLYIKIYDKIFNINN